MARKQYNSAADRRWQHRYERIQKRKADEELRQERAEVDDFRMECQRYYQQSVNYEELLRRQEEIRKLDGSAKYYHLYYCWIESDPFPTRNFTTWDKKLVEEQKEKCLNMLQELMAEAARRGYDELVDDFKIRYGYLFQELEEGDPTVLDEFLGGFATTVGEVSSCTQ